MAKPIPAYLKLHDENRAEEAAAAVDDSSVMADLCLAFAAATGWPLESRACDEEISKPQFSDSMCSAPVNPGVGIAPGHIRIGIEQSASNTAAVAARVSNVEAHPSADGQGCSPSLQRCCPDAANQLADAIARLLGQLAAARRIIRQRDAELAAGVPIVARAEESEQLAELLECVLRAGAEACDCQAAALYMLDDATTSLKLRASIGLSEDRRLQPPRPLKGAIADLEALLGHAVALERASAFGPWRVPEEFAAALCVPVSSPTIPLGTLWFFSDRPRDFTDRQTNVAELAAGRLAAELERTMLLAQIREQASAAKD